ncbi:hypothetical protein COW36_00600 [bacterium (Candidatus Blackallbacteria) CG17_big_fil_post_rev_8_21_14_2_50_48_46]|uniref:LPS export ABC transporter periplasmic protein LptC n=1 Tax=bacterium (Candidatus Blackallbacteria) CG17_big_fil_post_rev_8_21_14_2_50_48_46 TaxID=2014261 RepID=A0A2M7GB22_9BACT|nr:MAG: hypothetical protein COW64_10575 [bacterium (Candidatus Blackallbacteria) CG18_big_fil_WC_8_21_14_2_50_49_26]PIW19372.1 MAG: hypothetical protein COW36_00600 [bacterium (Candidatus Blackallbacteria) CG17_big_fil_post_rev_8_21_14_2_50_48_46]PIW49024.1 MAG: hypothetical protein COW20_07855 [bacterium (Candidatus Blackallbacteria) CG13_big_fil_rev_8_21_14_2_50_49_14]
MFFFISCQQQEHKQQTTQDNSSIEDFQISETINGQTKWVASAQKAQKTPHKERTFHVFRLNVEWKEPLMTLEADQAELKPGQILFQEGKGYFQDIKFEMKNFELKTKENMFYSDTLSLKSKNFSQTGIDLIADLNLKKLKYKKAKGLYLY